MKLLAIRLENVRRFIDPFEIAGIGSGLNVLTAPNESGKSTIFDALHAALFKSHRSWDRDVASLAPHAGGDPKVSVELEIDDAHFRVDKRWNHNRKGDVKVFRNGHLIKQADDAEAWLAGALKAPKDGGPAGLIWVRQGTTGFGEEDSFRTARRDLLSSVAGEVVAMTGGRRMDAALDRCRQELDRYVTGKGKARIGGPLKLADDEVSALETLRGELSAKVTNLRSELDRRRDLMRELTDLESAEQEAARKARLVEAQRAHDDADRHQQALEKAVGIAKSIRVDLERAEDRLTAIQTAIAESKTASSILESANADVVVKEELQREAEAALAADREKHDIASTAAEAASEALRRSHRAHTSERRAELKRQLARAEELRATLESAAAEAKVGPTDDVVKRLDGLLDDLRIARKTRENGSVALTMNYAPGRKAGVSANGLTLPDGARVAIPDGVALEIDGIGLLTVHPGARASDDAVRAAKKAFASALAAAGYDTMDALRAAQQIRLQAETHGRDAESQLNGIAPAGIEALLQELARLPEPVDFEEGHMSVVDAQEAEDAARHALANARESLERARATAGAAQTTAARAEAAAESAAERVARAKSALGCFEDPTAEEQRLTHMLIERRTALLAAVEQREAISSSAPDLEAAKAALERARSVIARASEDRQRIRIDLGKLDTAIEMHAAEAVEEELVDVDNRLSVARRRLDEITFEVSVLQKLDRALESARATARDRYVEPIIRELKPLIRLFWPEAELLFDPEDVLPTALVRAGTEEDFDVLSGGTQEQIALLVRLAFARMLAKSGQPTPVVLDDAIVYTDDERIERMFDALTRQAQDLQIIVFSCRQKAFRDLGGRSLAIAREEAALDAAE